MPGHWGDFHKFFNEEGGANGLKIKEYMLAHFHLT